MSDLKRRTFTCYLKTLSPIHVGCDEVYEPTAFVMDEKNTRLVAFDPFRFIGEMDPADREEFSEICKKGTLGSIMEMYQFLRGREADGKPVKVCGDFVRHYKETLKITPDDEWMIRQELNRFAIARTAFTPHDGLPYIPGSAVKGALRTGYLNGIARQQNEKIRTDRGKWCGHNLEKRVLKADKIEEDPFRLVRVSDFMPVGEAKTRIIYAVNEKKFVAKEGRGPYQILEVIVPGTLFAGEITVEEKHRKAPITSPVAYDDLLSFADRFYAGEQKRENSELREIGAMLSPDPSDDKTALIRLGRHSGAESVTLDGYRDIKIMTEKGQKPRYEDHATTLWLASEARKPASVQSLKPFGWAEFIDVEIIRQREREAEKRRKAEAEQQAALEAMSPEERDIMAVRDPSVMEQRVVEIFGRIDQFPADKKQELAQALKAYWERCDKWEKKKCAKKQWKKVQKIRGVLGE